MMSSKPATQIVLCLAVISALSGHASAQDVAATYEVLATFDPPEAKGARPVGGLVQGSDGSFYGVTYEGGANGHGTVFRIDSDGTLTTLHAFALFTDGAWPVSGLVPGSDGHFYGTTSAGGPGGGAGTVFRIDSSGTLTTLYAFSGWTDGQEPGRLVQVSDGSFYGTTRQGGPTSRGTVFHLHSNGTLTTLHVFGGGGGEFPNAELVQGSDGSFYGTTVEGGAHGRGTVFRIDSGGTLTTLHSFSGNNDGGSPFAGLMRGSDGDFYGTTFSGGANGWGTVFRIDSNGTLTTLYAFQETVGGGPQTRLLEASDGTIYGTTTYAYGGLGGMVFRLDSNGTLTALHKFMGDDGAYPDGRLTQASDGSFYDTVSRGGPGDHGVIFRLQIVSLPPQDLLEVTGAPANAEYGTSFTVDASGGSGTGALSFSATGACSNPGGGALVTMTSGTGTCSIVATKASDGQYSSASSEPALVDAIKATSPTLTITGAPFTAPHDGSFAVGTSGGSDTGAVTFEVTGACTNTNGRGIITMTSATGTCSIIATKAADANSEAATSAAVNVTATERAPFTYQVVGVFDPANVYGAHPYGGLVEGSDGSFYGTTTDGGANGHGTVFRLASDGTLTTLHSFALFTDGAWPGVGLVQGSDGRFYGTTAAGGPGGGAGTVFRIDTSGTLTTLYTFGGYYDGQEPRGVVQASDGSFYGTTRGGGPNSRGTVFRLHSDGTLTTLHIFQGSDGAFPNAFLVQGSDGNFYGTTSSGGLYDLGTVFRIGSSGTLTTLYSFDGTAGRSPFAGLIRGSDGRFYGTTFGGGANGYGTVFRIDGSGSVTTLHAFAFTDGGSLQSRLLEASDGSLYGTTNSVWGGMGSVFRLTPDGTLTTMHKFTGSDGMAPNGGVIQGSDGSLYGTAARGGPGDAGLIFRVPVDAQQSQQPLELTGAPASAPYGTSFTVAASGGSGTGMVTFSTSGACSNIAGGAEITMTSGTGTCSIVAAKAGDEQYFEAVSEAALVTATKAAQTALTVTGAPAAATYDASFTVATSGGSGTGAVLFSTSGACTNAAGAVTMTSGTGTCSITATKAGGDNYIDAMSEPVLVAATKAEQAPLTITGAPPAAPYATTFTVDTSGGSGTGDVTFTISGACSNIGPTLIQMTSGIGTCSIAATKAGDDNYLASAQAHAVVSILDVTGPEIFFASTDTDGGFPNGSDFPVYVVANDSATVANVSINGVAATLIAGTSESGVWQAQIVTPASGPLTLAVTATDALGNDGTKTIILDNDGIDSVIDRAKDDYSIDQSTISSSEFNDGVTSGTVSGQPLSFRVSKPGGDGVRVSLSFGTLTASLCSGTEKFISLDNAGEQAHVMCDGPTVIVTAVEARPHIELYKLATDLDGYSYYLRINLETGQRVSTGSPVVADASNTTPIVVTIVQRGDDGTETPVGTFSLDPGESAELSNVTPGQNREDLLELKVLNGQVEATLNGVEQDLGPGTHTFQPDLTSPVPSLFSTAGNPTSLSPIHVSVVFDEPVQGFHDGELQLVNAKVQGFTGSGAVYSFDLVPDGDGVVSVTVPAGVAVDAAGNGNVAGGLSRTYVQRVDQTVTFEPINDATYGALPLTLTATASSGLPVSFAASGSCAVSGSTLTLVGVGLCTVTASQAGNDAYHAAPDVQRTFRVLHSWSGVLQPVNADGSSVFKLGSSVPVKFRLTNGSAGVTNLAARLYLRYVSNGIVGTEVEAVSTGAADSGNVFRYADGEYILTLSTKGLKTGTWELRIDLLDGESRSVVVSLSK